jgi:hypothetical protein
VLEADVDELHQVLRREPDREPAAVDGRIAEVADADAGDAQPVLEGVERGERLAEGLADAIAGIRAHRIVDANAALARIETDGVVRGGEHDPLHAVAVRGLEQVVAAYDVGLQDRLPRPFDREAAEMHDAVDASDHALDLRHVGEVGSNKSFVGPQIRRALDVAQTEVGIDALEQLPQSRADAARGAGDQDRLHALLVSDC